MVKFAIKCFTFTRLCRYTIFS